MTENITKRQVAKYLREAAKLVDKGWVRRAFQGQNEDGINGFCAIGAIRKVTAGSAYSVNKEGAAARQALLKRIHASYPYTNIPGWNDNIAKNAQEVSGLMRRTARELEHGGEL